MKLLEAMLLVMVGLYIKMATFGLQMGWMARAQGVDTDPKAFTSHTVSTVFSTTKTITAACALGLFRNNSLDASAKIIDYLPSRWSKYPSIQNHIMQDLLSHRSGITSTLDRFTQMRTKAYTGTYTTAGQFAYANINFTLFRVIIPYIMNKTELEKKVF